MQCRCRSLSKPSDPRRNQDLGEERVRPFMSRHSRSDLAAGDSYVDPVAELSKRPTTDRERTLSEQTLRGRIDRRTNSATGSMFVQGLPRSPSSGSASESVRLSNRPMRGCVRADAAVRMTVSIEAVGVEQGLPRPRSLRERKRERTWRRCGRTSFAA